MSKTIYSKYMPIFICFMPIRDSLLFNTVMKACKTCFPCVFTDDPQSPGALSSGLSPGSLSSGPSVQPLRSSGLNPGALSPSDSSASSLSSQRSLSNSENLSGIIEKATLRSKERIIGYFEPKLLGVVELVKEQKYQREMLLLQEQRLENQQEELDSIRSIVSSLSLRYSVGSQTDPKVEGMVLRSGSRKK